MLSIIGIGDNVVDKYLHLGVMFPGGNSVNVPVLAARIGAKAAYIGVVGTDRAGALVSESMRKEGVNISRLKVVNGPNAYAGVNLVDGERVFTGGDGGVSTQIWLTDDDLEFTKRYNLIHSSVYSYLEHLVPAMAATGVPISYDFSDIFDDDYLNKIAPYVTYAFFSGGDAPLSDIMAFQKKVNALGPKIVLVTRGRHGAIVYDGESYVEQGVEPAEIVDTMGAGDSFIAQFLVSLHDGESLAECMKKAARYAALNCGFKGTFGYEAPIE